jgi:putative membrane protein
MIERYTDHAANERTFLAWVRTSIAIMAFGFLVEKFDLFLEFASKSLAARMPSVGGQLVGNIAGLLLIVLGGATMILAIIRFRQTALDIDSKDTRPGTGDRMDVILAALLVILGAALFVYLSYTLISRIWWPQYALVLDNHRARAAKHRWSRLCGEPWASDGWFQGAVADVKVFVERVSITLDLRWKRPPTVAASLFIDHIFDDEFRELNHKLSELGVFFYQSWYINMILVMPMWLQSRGRRMMAWSRMCVSHGQPPLRLPNAPKWANK